MLLSLQSPAWASNNGSVDCVLCCQIKRIRYQAGGEDNHCAGSCVLSVRYRHLRHFNIVHHCGIGPDKDKAKQRDHRQAR